MKVTSDDQIWKLVKGKTVIDHQIRVKLNLTFDEYIVADFLHQLLKKHPKSVLFNTTFPMSDHALKTIGENDIQWYTLVSQRLIEKGILIVSKPGKFEYSLTKKWLDEFDVSADFVVFWETIFKKHGNRATAESRYEECRKLVDKDTLHERAKKYVDTREDFPNYTKAAEVWLNPKKRHWEDVLPGDNDAPPSQTEGVIGQE